PPVPRFSGPRLFLPLRFPSGARQAHRNVPVRPAGAPPAAHSLPRVGGPSATDVPRRSVAAPASERRPRLPVFPSSSPPVLLFPGLRPPCSARLLSAPRPAELRLPRSSVPARQRTGAAGGSA